MKSLKSLKYVRLIAIILCGVCVCGGLTGCHDKQEEEKFIGSIVLSDSQLDKPLLSYEYDGTQYNVTARMVYESSTGLLTMQTSQGYKTPSLNDLANTARDQILAQECKKKGISVSDEEIKNFIVKEMGLKTIDDLAKRYGISAQAAQKIVYNIQANIKLRKDVLGSNYHDISYPAPPQAPQTTEDNPVNEQYAQYVMKFIGDEYDIEKGAWKRQDGPYYKALQGFTFSPKAASYSTAVAAHTVACLQVADKNSQADALWNNYVNSLFTKVSLEAKTLGY